MRSSIGFKELTLSKYLFNNPNGSRELMARFQKFDQRTNSLQFDKDDQGNDVIKFRPGPSGIEGIEWLIRSDLWKDRRLAPVEVKINPKLFLGRHDDVTPATYKDMNDIIIEFESVAKRISPSFLRNFDAYRLDDVNYCCYFDVNELSPGCTLEQLTYLIERARMLPLYHREPGIGETPRWPEPDPNMYPNKCHMWDEGLDISCYQKNIELLKQKRDIICFEFQCKCRDTMGDARARNHLSTKFNLYEDALTYKVCDKIIDFYLTVTIGNGSWYSLRAAIAEIEHSCSDSAKKRELIDALKFVSKCQNPTISAKRCLYDGVFGIILNDLDKMGINPITIPEDWGIDYIQNLLRAYHIMETNGYEDSYTQWQMEQDLEYMAEIEKSKKKLPAKYAKNGKFACPNHASG